MANNYREYLLTYNGRELLKKHNLDTLGFWQIRGEDPNCDMGGYHHEPDLGMLEGILKYAIEYAVNLPSFWTWGGGGRIVLISRPKNLTSGSVSNWQELLAQRAALKVALIQVEIALELKA